MSILGIQNNGHVDTFRQGNYSLAGVRSLCVKFRPENTVDVQEEEESGLYGLYELFNTLKTLPKAEVVLKFICIRLNDLDDNRRIPANLRNLWFRVLRQITELPTYPVLLIDIADEPFPNHFDLKNISKLYFIYPDIPLHTLLDLEMVKNSCLTDLGIVCAVEDRPLTFAHEMDMFHVHRPIDLVSFAAGVRDTQDLPEFVSQYHATSWCSHFAFEIRYNRDMVHNANAVIHLLYCTWKFSRNNIWRVLPRDVFYLILSLLHPMHWKLYEADRPRKRFTVRKSTWAKTVGEVYHVARNARDAKSRAESTYRYNLTRRDNIQRQMENLERELQALPTVISSSEQRVRDTQEAFESALVKLDEVRKTNTKRKGGAKRGRERPLETKGAETPL